MDGFHIQGRDLPTRMSRKPRLSIAMTGTVVAFSLCLISGCATMQGAKKDLHLATGCAAGSPCDCSCGECIAKSNGHDATSIHEQHKSFTGMAGQEEFVIPPGGQPGYGRTVVQPKPMTIEGTRGVWTPDPSAANNSDEFNSAESAFNQTPHTARNSQSSVGNPSMRTQTAAENQDVSHGWQNTDQGAMCPPGVAKNDAQLKEYLTQIQVLSQQISHVMQTQESIKASQETLQQAHEREILELKLQQAMADRSRLEREREMDRELQKQRERELETIDSFSQIIESVAQTPVPTSPSSGARLRPAPRTSTEASQGDSQMLPGVDGSRQ